jgi:hypothetical protein
MRQQHVLRRWKRVQSVVKKTGYKSRDALAKEQIEHESRESVAK